MRILLLVMPDTTDFFHYSARLPNLGIASLAGNLPGHQVRVLDLLLWKPKIRQRLQKLLDDFQPEMVGLSAMTFQFYTLVRVARFIRDWNPGVRIAAGGYHVTVLGRETADDQSDLPLDFIVRGEG
ncbi:MAG: cobalamin-dependent protein, partial [Pseudomonadota bacterium]